jgi:hypothetical protein
VDPVNGASGVPTSAVAQLTFDERINPLTVNTSNFFLENSATGVDVAGQVTVAVDGLTATFTPDAPLAAGTGYRLRAFNSIQDLAGNAYAGTSVPTSFTTAP